MEYQISEKGYEAKPTKGQFNRMRWERVDTDLPDLVSYLESGHTYRANLLSTSNSGKRDLVSTQVLFLDIERKTENPPALKDFLENSKITPTFYYETFSSTGGDRYRLGFTLDKPITDTKEYKAIVKAVVDYTGVLTEGMVDPKSYDPRQNMCGTDKEVGISYRGYRLNDLRTLAEGFIEEDTERRTKEKPEHKPTYEEYDLMCDFLAQDGTFESWIRDNTISLPFVSETPPTDQDDTYFYYSDYVTLVRKLVNGSYYHQCPDGRYRNNTFHDGERRRKKIIINCSLIHQIYPDCSLEELLVLTCQMFLLFFSNDREDRIGREFIWRTVINEWHCPFNAKTPFRIRKRFRTRLYEDGKPMHWKRQAKIHYSSLITSLYDFSISLESNLENLNVFFSESKDDYRVSESVLENYLKETKQFYWSDKEKPIKTLKRMIRSGVARKECLDFLLSHKDSIGKNQMTKYKRLLS